MTKQLPAFAVPGNVAAAPPSKALKSFVAAKPPSALRREERGERLAVYLPEDIATELRVYCAKSRRSLSDAVSEAVRALVASDA